MTNHGAYLILIDHKDKEAMLSFVKDLQAVINKHYKTSSNGLSVDCVLAGFEYSAKVLQEQLNKSNK